jgi:hypothetical protein
LSEHCSFGRVELHYMRLLTASKKTLTRQDYLSKAAVEHQRHGAAVGAEGDARPVIKVLMRVALQDTVHNRRLSRGNRRRLLLAGRQGMSGPMAVMVACAILKENRLVSVRMQHRTWVRMRETNWGLSASNWCFFACLAFPAGEGAITM